MIDREHVRRARSTIQRGLPRPFGQTGPRLSARCRLLFGLRSSPNLDNRQMSPVRDEADAQFQRLAATTANVSRRSSARRSTRPPLARFKARRSTRRDDISVDLLRRRAVQDLMRPMAVEPIDVQRQLAAEDVTLVGDEQPTSALVLDRSNQPFDHGDAAVLADSAEALLNAAATAIHQQNGQHWGSANGSQDVQSPRDVGTVLRSQCQM